MPAKTAPAPGLASLARTPSPSLGKRPLPFALSLDMRIKISCRSRGSLGALDTTQRRSLANPDHQPDIRIISVVICQRTDKSRPSKPHYVHNSVKTPPATARHRGDVSSRRILRWLVARQRLEQRCERQKCGLDHLSVFAFRSNVRNGSKADVEAHCSWHISPSLAGRGVTPVPAPREASASARATIRRQ
jgi:hypothetical protein